MGNSSGTEIPTKEEIKVLMNCADLKAALNSKHFSDCSLSNYSWLHHQPNYEAEKQFVQYKLGLQEKAPETDPGLPWTVETDRAVGALLAQGIGDALGSPLEFSEVRYTNELELKGLHHTEIWQKRGYNAFHLNPGQWTDDLSMGLCLAESLLSHPEEFNPRDLRMRFLHWWRHGYCNAFGYDLKRFRRSSVGLGGNISQSFMEFAQSHSEFTQAGDLWTSGNGSLMRLSPVPIRYWKDVEKAQAVAWAQSKTTHQGDEAADLCRLMSSICIKAINWPADWKQTKRSGTRAQAILDAALEEFETKFYTVQCLAQSDKEERHPENSKPKQLSLRDRNWNWKADKYYYAPSRAQSQPGYIGSYAMDAAAMSLHCIWHTTSFSECMLKIANYRGDADSVCAIAGTALGAIYGASGIPQDWIQTVQKWDNGGEIAYRAYRLWALGAGHQFPAQLEDPQDCGPTTEELEATHTQEDTQPDEEEPTAMATEEENDKGSTEPPAGQ